MFKIITYILLFIFLYSCGGAFDSVKRGLTGEKKNSTDEFLVKKRQPLTLPPDYKNLPEPRSENLEKENERNTINKILKIPENKVTKKGSSNVEQSIISQIRK